MKNIHILPTNKPSNIVISTITGELKLNNNVNDSVEYHGQNQHIYITSDEEIKVGWYFNTAIGVNKPVYLKSEDINGLKNIYGTKPSHLQEIILTTDQDLINDGIEQISEDTLLKIVEHINSGKNIKSFDELFEQLKNK